MSRIFPLALLALVAGSAALPARADDAADFIANFSGAWLGTGQLLVGAENGVKFSCELAGNPIRSELSFGMQGRCWMGPLSAPVHARLRYNRDTSRFYGRFLDGSEGSGLDIVGARAGDGFSLQLTRSGVQGRLTAEAVSPDQMTITIFYRDRASNRELPVVAMGLARKNSGEALPDYLSGVVTGSAPRDQQ